VREKRVAENELLFRRLNEQIRKLADPWEQASLDAVCECADIDCFEHLAIPAADYDRLRQHPYRFAVAPGHELPQFEKVVERHPGYLVVEKPEEALKRARS
jgi:hypothetical protein